MNVTTTRPFHPYISLEQICNFDSRKPETYTESRFINELCIAFEKVGCATDKTLASYMELDQRDLAGAVKVLTGYRLADLREKVAINRIKRLAKSADYYDANEIARIVGYADRSGLYRMLGQERYDQLVAQYVRS